MRQKEKQERRNEIKKMLEFILFFVKNYFKRRIGCLLFFFKFSVKCNKQLFNLPKHFINLFINRA